MAVPAPNTHAHAILRLQSNNNWDQHSLSHTQTYNHTQLYVSYG